MLFGATGDLSRRKLLRPCVTPPPVGTRARHPGDWDVAGGPDRGRVSRTLPEAVTEFSHHPLTEEHWSSFAGATHVYTPICRWPKGLGKLVRVAEEKLGGPHGRLHYLSVPPVAAPMVINTLREADLVERSRVVMEKPARHRSGRVRSRSTIRCTRRKERQIFRIDHFLGKEAR